MLFWSSLDDNFDDKIFSWVFETQRTSKMAGRWAYKRRWDETILSFETGFVLSAHRGDIKYGWMSLSGNEWRMEAKNPEAAEKMRIKGGWVD